MRLRGAEGVLSSSACMHITWRGNAPKGGTLYEFLKMQCFKKTNQANACNCIFPLSKQTYYFPK